LNLDTHERKILFKLAHDGERTCRNRSRLAWLYGFTGVMFLSSSLVDWPDYSDTWAGVGSLWLALAVHEWIDLRRFRLLRKLMGELDRRDPSWLTPPSPPTAAAP
jgi:hypothetical protein